MDIRVTCPKCKAVLTLGADAPGAALRCPNCLTSFTAGGGQIPERTAGPSAGAPAPSRNATARRLGWDSVETPPHSLRPQTRASSRTGLWVLVGLGAAAALVLLIAGLSLLGRGPEPKEAAVSPGPQEPAHPAFAELPKAAQPEGAVPPKPESEAAKPPGVAKAWPQLTPSVAPADGPPAPEPNPAIPKPPVALPAPPEPPRQAAPTVAPKEEPPARLPAPPEPAKQAIPPKDQGEIDELPRPGPDRDLKQPGPAGPPKSIYSNRLSRLTGSFLGGSGGTSARAESCVNAGLIWLAKAQDKDGHWDCKSWDGAGNYDVGTTGLALLAFLGAGYTHTKGRYQTIVARGLDWLRYNQKPTGAFGYQTFYEQGIATIAVCEAYGLTRSEDVRPMAQKAVDFIVRTQPDHGGFRYQGAVDKENGDLSVSGWQIMALKSGICSELNVPQVAIERSRVLLKNTLREYGGSAYTVATSGATPAMTAIGMLCRQFIGNHHDAEINAAANYLLEREKRAVRSGTGGQKDALVYDLYYTFYSTLAMFQMGGEYWAQWNKMVRDPLVRLQETKNILDARGRFIRGSWDPKDTMWGAQGGRVFSTAMAVLCLEVYYRFARLPAP